MTDIKHLRPTKLLWVDLEMTGLDPATQHIIEIAAKVTDFDFTELASYEALIRQPEEVFEQATEWNKQNHGIPGGLFDRAREQGKPEEQVVGELVELVRGQFGAEPAVLAGNSIHQDRRFIRQWWPDVEKLLHYRMLDVSSLKIYMQGKYGLDFAKQESHRALGDIEESIAEWQFYMDWLLGHGSQDR